MDGPRKNGKCCEDIGMNGHHEKWNTHPTRRTERLRQLRTDPAALRQLGTVGTERLRQLGTERLRQWGQLGTEAKTVGNRPSCTAAKSYPAAGERVGQSKGRGK